jgi:hypothetical protein
MGQLAPDSKLSCGPGCRLAMAKNINHTTGWVTSAALSGLVDVSDGGLKLHHVLPGDTTTTEYDFLSTSPGQGFLQVHLFGDFVSYLRYDNEYESVELMDLKTGAYRSYAATNNQTGPSATMVAHNDSFVFWNDDGVGVFAAERATGEVHQIATGLFGCGWWCASDKGVYCASDAVLFFGQDATKEVAIAPGPGEQKWGVCSPHRNAMAFVDYRDNPSFGGVDKLDYGDVYTVRFDTLEVSRVTFDAPKDNVPKSAVAVDGDVVAWRQVPAGWKKTASVDVTTVAALASTLVLRDGKLGRTCTWDKSVLLANLAVFDRRLYGTVLIGKDAYLAEVDIDDPAVPWTCAQTGALGP